MPDDEKYEVPAIYEAPTITVLGEVTELTQHKHGSVHDYHDAGAPS
jgi:hypothetical protein